MIAARVSGVSCWLSLGESSGEIVPEDSVVGGGCAFPFFEGYGLEGVEGSRTRSYEACGVSVDQDHTLIGLFAFTAVFSP